MPESHKSVIQARFRILDFGLIKMTSPDHRRATSNEQPVTSIQYRERPMNRIITIDGPAGSGKSTISRILARKIGYSYLDTGAMYRAVALAAKRKGVGFHDGKELGILCSSLNLRFDKDGDPPKLLLGKEDISRLIRSPEMDMLSSEISAVGEVREAMTGLQRKIAKGAGYVAEGRDMGTVVFPEAAWKFYLTASSDARAGRRYEEILERGETAQRDIVKADLEKRDDQDRTRPLAPLKPAEDALIIDSTTLTIEEVVEVMLRNVDKTTSPTIHHGFRPFLPDLK